MNKEIAAETWTKALRLYHEGRSDEALLCIQAAIEKATVHLRQNLKDLAQAANEIRKDRDALRAAHASDASPRCVLCGEKHHPDTVGHSFLPREPAHASEWKQSDPDYARHVVVDANHNYVATALDETNAKLFINAHNATLQPPHASEKWIGEPTPEELKRRKEYKHGYQQGVRDCSQTDRVEGNAIIHYDYREALTHEGK